MKNTRTPWLLVFKYVEICATRLLIWSDADIGQVLLVSMIWLIYDFSSYSFSIYSSAWLTIILGDSAPIWKSFGWNTIINLFYLPGAIAGAFLSDILGPKLALGSKAS